MSSAIRLTVCFLTVILCCSGAEGQDSIRSRDLSGLSSLISPIGTLRDTGGQGSRPSGIFLPPEFRLSGMGIRADASFDIGDAGGILKGVKHHFELKGPSIELSQRAFLSDETGVFVNATYLVPTYQNISETLSYLFGDRHFDWALKTQLWTVGGGAGYNASNSLTVVGGAQYASFDLTFDSIIAGSGLGRMINPDSSVEVRGASPFLGVVVNANSSVSNLNAGLLVCPAVLGSLEYSLAAAPAGTPSRISGRFVKTRFLVLAIEYARNIQLGHVGGFVRWTPVQGQFVINFNENPTFPVALVDGSMVTFNVQVINLGVKFFLPFSLPF